MRLNPRYLVVFCVVAELRSLSRAAEVLNLSQPAVSKTLKALESVLRQSLYERTPQGIVLTEAGKALLPYACAVNRSLAHAARFIQERRYRRVPRLEVGLAWSLIPRYQSRLLLWAKAHLNRCELHLTNGTTLELIEKVYQRDLEAALVLGGTDDLPEPLLARRLTSDEVVLVVAPGHPWADLGGAALGQLEGAVLLVPQRNSRLRLRLEQFLERHGIVPQQVLECGSLYGVKTAAAAGLGVGLACRSFVEPEVAAGALRALLIEDAGFSLGVHWVAYPESSVDLAARELLEHLRGYLEAPA
ncbi:HTH-type transcriptional regulator GltR [Meiothermus luteus]|jgi:DNA-binding transcriptional LysR family regulator|uniref:HTH-type transcriptional regulator GltR n=1 Tax=Meiothermus luteus TaxID=2026184 RepID=A0A399F4C3_9DEIN|nr:LysR family transcriptional regulator [Meiothermus luteus]RIH89712.1 HTH-type transcriptional regulator GltR [Meiothermus luteus]RMH57833.1 MAG: LysR family transcriptional regulator [Deinococcota bacterium]